jgi:mevalonate kinase
LRAWGKGINWSLSLEAQRPFVKGWILHHLQDATAAPLFRLHFAAHEENQGTVFAKTFSKTRVIIPGTKSPTSNAETVNARRTLSNLTVSTEPLDRLNLSKLEVAPAINKSHFKHLLPKVRHNHI